MKRKSDTFEWVLCHKGLLWHLREMFVNESVCGLSIKHWIETFFKREFFLQGFLSQVLWFWVLCMPQIINNGRYYLSFSLTLLLFFGFKALLTLQLEMMEFVPPSAKNLILFSAPSLLFFLVLHLLYPQPIHTLLHLCMASSLTSFRSLLSITPSEMSFFLKFSPWLLSHIMLCSFTLFFSFFHGTYYWLIFCNKSIHGLFSLLVFHLALQCGPLWCSWPIPSTENCA